MYLAVVAAALVSSSNRGERNTYMDVIIIFCVCSRSLRSIKFIVAVVRPLQLAIVQQQLYNCTAHERLIVKRKWLVEH